VREGVGGRRSRVWVCVMKIVSWNVRGLGGFAKRREVTQLVREKQPFILCIQETKLVLLDVQSCIALWGDVNVDFSFQPSVGASGGLATLWDKKEVDVWLSMSFEHMLVIAGKFVKSGEQFILFNVYAPCDVHRQEALWVSISHRLNSLTGQNVCICGDFNVVRYGDERKSVGGVFSQASSAHYNNFIDGNGLIDLPLRGRRYTWFRGDGRSMSRLDRFLLSENWCLSWPNCLQLASARGLSDHCPVILSVDEANWGLRPLRMLKCWESLPGYRNYVREKWTSFHVDGWGGYVLKEKFKMIKFALREWHQTHSQNLPAKIMSLKDKISALDLKGETTALCDEEVEDLHGLTELFSLSRINSSICWQQSRLNWLREGDANSKFFHGLMSSRKRRNNIPFFLVDGTVVEGVDNVRNSVFSHFQSHFRSSSLSRPTMGNMEFKALSGREGAGLIKKFTVEEVKVAVWDCDSYKCPGPDGVSFGFIKYFWDILKDDLMRFLMEFHRNGKLSKGINSTFISLIPKVDSPQ